MPKRDDLKYKALQMIMESGEEGILQCDLWRRLGATSREGSRIALKLVRRGLVRREKVLYNGRWTFKLYPTWRRVTVDSILDCPCFACPDSPRCGPWGSTSPNECEKLTEWLLQLAKEEDS